MTTESLELDGARPTAEVDPPRAAPWRRPPIVVGATTLVLAVPLLIALGVLHDPTWFPHGEIALTEMHVRDVPTFHPRLVGLNGRLRGYGTTGSHPGPLSFYALWPVYRLFGSDGWALQVSTAALSLLAAAVSVTIAQRRGGWPLAVAVGSMLVLLMRGYGAVILIQPWNPQLPMLWWVVFLLATWSVLCDDLRLLPVAVFAVSFCMQTHVAYLAVGAGVSALLIGGLGLAVVRAQRQHDRAGRRRLLRSIGIAGGVGFVLWLPPLIEELTHDPGNASIIFQNFRHPYDAQVAFGDAVEMFFIHFDVRQLLTTHRATSGSAVPGLLLLLAWAAAFALALRRKEPALLRLHAVAGTAALFGLVAMSRIFGVPWNYLMLWAWGTTAVVLLATAWTFLSLVRPATDTSDLPPVPAGEDADASLGDRARALSVPALSWPRPTVAVVAAAGLFLTVLFSIDAASTEMPNHQVGAQVIRMTRSLVAALADDPAGCGDDCRYLLTAVDPEDGIAKQTALMVALERHGIEADAPAVLTPIVGSQHVVDPADADARIHLAVGELAIDQMEHDPGARRVTVFGLTGAQRTQLRAARRNIVDRLEEAGLDDLATTVASQELIREDPAMPPDVIYLVRGANSFPRRSAIYLLDPASGAGDDVPAASGSTPDGAKASQGEQ